MGTSEDLFEEKINSLLGQGDFEEVERLTRNALSPSASLPHQVFVNVTRARALVRLGEESEALTCSMEAVQRARDTQNVRFLVMTLDSRAEIRCFAHEYAGALVTLQAADEYIRTNNIQDRHLSALLNQTRGIAYAGCGLWEQAERSLEQATEEFRYLRLWAEWTHAAGDFAVTVLGRADNDGVVSRSVGRALEMLTEALPLVESKKRAHALMQLHVLRLRAMRATVETSRGGLERLAHEYLDFKEAHHGLMKGALGLPLSIEWTNGTVFVGCHWLKATGARDAADYCRGLVAWVSVAIKYHPGAAPMRVHKMHLLRVLAQSGVATATSYLQEAAATFDRCRETLQSVLSRFYDPQLRRAAMSRMKSMVEEIAHLARTAEQYDVPALATRLVGDMQILRAGSRAELSSSVGSEKARKDREYASVQARLFELEAWLKQVESDLSDSGKSAQPMLPIRGLKASAGSEKVGEQVVSIFPDYERLQTLNHLQREVERQRNRFLQLTRTLTGGGGTKSTGQIRLPSIDEMQAVLADDDWVLDYHLGNESLHVIVISRRGVSVKLVASLSTYELTQRVDSFLNELRREDTESSPMNDSLSRLLLPDEISSEIRNGRVKRLFIVPTEALWRLPFAFLWIDGKHLLEQTALCVVPALRFIGIANHAEVSVGDALVVGCEGKPPLASLEREVSVISRVLGCGSTWDRSEGTQPPTPMFLLHDVLPKRGLVHICCHGEQVLTSPLLSNLQLFPDEQHPNGKLTLGELSDARVVAGLVNLAACETLAAQGPEAFPESLAHSVLGAGARFVLASLWKPNDVETSRFNSAFYEELKGCADVVACFSKAMRRRLEELREGEGQVKRSVVKTLGVYVLMGAHEAGSREGKDGSA